MNSRRVHTHTGTDMHTSKCNSSLGSAPLQGAALLKILGAALQAMGCSTSKETVTTGQQGHADYGGDYPFVDKRSTACRSR